MPPTLEDPLGASNPGTSKVPPTFGDLLSASNLWTNKVPPTLGPVKCLQPWGTHNVPLTFRWVLLSGSLHLGPGTMGPSTWDPNVPNLRVWVPVLGSQHLGPFIWVPGPGSQGPIKCLCSMLCIIYSVLRLIFLFFMPN